MMSFSEVHRAVRDLVRASPHHGFVLGVSLHEHHPGRSDIQWTLYLSAPKAFYKASEPERLIALLRFGIDSQFAPPRIESESIGDIPAAEDGES